VITFLISIFKYFSIPDLLYIAVLNSIVSKQ
jgi:hypothetical protein